MNEVYLFDLIHLILSIIASGIISYVSTKSKDLLNWLPAYYSFTLAYFFNFLQVQIVVFLYFKMLFFTTACFLIFIAIFIDYEHTFNKNLNYKKTKICGITLIFTPIIIIVCYFFLLRVLFISMI